MCTEYVSILFPQFDDGFYTFSVALPIPPLGKIPSVVKEESEVNTSAIMMNINTNGFR